MHLTYPIFLRYGWVKCPTFATHFDGHIRQIGRRVKLQKFDLYDCLDLLTFFPDVVKLVDTSDLGSDAVRCGGSSPSIRTY